MSAPARAPGDEPPTDTPAPEAAPPPRPLIRPALRPSGTPSAPRPVINPAARGIVPVPQAPPLPPDAPLAQARDEASEETTRPGSRHPTADLGQHVAPPLPIMPGLGDEGDAPSFNHTVRGFTRAQIEQAASRSLSAPKPRTSIDAAHAAAAIPEAAPIPAPPIAAAPVASPPAIPNPLSAPVSAPAALAEPLSAPAGADPRQREIRRAPDPTVTVLRPRVTSILPTVSVTALILLFSAIVLPTAGGPPWELLARPAEVTLQALAGFILIGVVHLLPTRERTRAILGVVVGIVLLGFAFVAWRVATTRGAFDAQPALDALFASPLPNPALPALLALVLVPAGLFARGRSAQLPAWVLGGLGLVAALVTFVWMSPAALFTSLGGASFLGDRIGAFATLPLLIVLVVACAAMAPGLRRFATGFGFGLWALALLPLAVFALFAAKSDQWMQVLEPLKLVIFLGAVSLYAAAAVASVATQPRGD